MINKDNFNFIQQNYKCILQNLTAIFKEYLNTDIIIGFYNKNSVYTTFSNAELFQINAQNELFIIKYKIQDKTQYKVIPFKFIDIKTFNTSYNQEDDPTCPFPPQLKFDLLIDFYNI